MISLKTLAKTYEIHYAIDDDAVRQMRDDTSPGTFRPQDVAVKINDRGFTEIEYTGARYTATGQIARKESGRRYLSFGDYTDGALADSLTGHIISAAAREFGLLDPDPNI